MIRFNFAGHAAVALAIVAAATCGDQRPAPVPGETWTPAQAGLTLHIPRREIAAAIAAHLAKKQPAPLDDETWRHAKRLYAKYKNDPLWLNGDGLDKPRVAALMLALSDVSADGLRIEDYPLAQLGAAIDALSATDPTPEELAYADVLLTANYVALGTDLMTGQLSPRAMYQSWHIAGKEERVDSALFRSIRADSLGKAIAAMHPHEEAYDSLRVQLEKYRAAAAKGWTRVPDGKVLIVGRTDSRPRITALKRRLSEEGFWADSMDRPLPRDADARAKLATTFTKALAASVGRFQSHHGIIVDGTLGAETINAMNVAPEYRAAQIAANLERYRWMPRALGEKYILVNVPAFQLTAYDSGKQVLAMKVIVGEEYEGKATPAFADTMTTVVFRPYWLVTPNIQKAEFDPQIQKDTGFMHRGGYEFYQQAGIQRIRQKPGPTNALGLVKFLFPNDFNIYLHDTPNGALFKKDVRAFSHGCIRVEKPDELAQFVLGWSLDSVHAAMNTTPPDNKGVSLKQHIPVFITYFTTYVTDSGLYFGNDLYKRDDVLADAISPGAIPSDESLRAAAALRESALALVAH